MKSIAITINSLPVKAPAGSTILDAAGILGISIPSLCYQNGFQRFTSCMVCVVQEIRSGRLLPACSAPVTEGMQIDTENSAVREARKDALDFLLSEHVGDCEAPCQRACPAHMNIPQMISQIESGRFQEAIVTVKDDIALPAVLGRICSAPCEKGCNRKFHDEAVAVCLLKRIAADIDLERSAPYRPAQAPATGKRIAVIGAGPTGLAAAYYLRRYGHDCDIYDRNPNPGGMLRYGIPEDTLPRSVLDSEIARIQELGAAFHMNRTIGKDISLDALRETHDALVLAVGALDPESWEESSLARTPRGFAVDRATLQTGLAGVFAGGNAVTESRMAVRSVEHGKRIAASVDQFVSGLPVTGLTRRFNSLLGKLREGEVEEFLKEAEEHSRQVPAAGSSQGFSESEARKEAARCFQCDCRKLESCRLRAYADEYAAEQPRFKTGVRRPIQKIIRHKEVVFEPGKCIKCGLCVQITRRWGEPLGLTFVGRGFDVRIDTPFHEPLDRALLNAADACIEACPTAALSRRRRARS